MDKFGQVDSLMDKTTNGQFVDTPVDEHHNGGGPFVAHLKVL
jgi:hypothetical protein